MHWQQLTLLQLYTSTYVVSSNTDSIPVTHCKSTVPNLPHCRTSGTCKASNVSSNFEGLEGIVTITLTMQKKRSAQMA